MSDRTHATPDGRPDLDSMERDIRGSRARMGETIDTVKRRLSARHTKETMMHASSHNPRNTAASVGGMVRGNPVPLALIGLGIGWLVLSQTGADERVSRSGVARRFGDASRQARGHLHDAGESVRHAAGSAYDRAGSTVRSAGEQVRSWTQADDRGHEDPDGSRAGGAMARGRARRTLDRAGSGFWDMVDDHPLVAGIMGVALGAALGAGIPSSRYEDRLVGDYSDEAYDYAKDMARETMERSSRAAQAAYEAARADLKHAAGDVKHAAGDAADAAKEEFRS